MYPLELLLIERKRRMYLEIWNRRQRLHAPAQVDDGDTARELSVRGLAKMLRFRRGSTVDSPASKEEGV